MRNIAVFGSVLVSLLFSASCKKKTPDVSVVRDDSEVSVLSSPVKASIAPNSLSEDQFDDALRNLSPPQILANQSIHELFLRVRS